MAGTSRSAPVGTQADTGAWVRADTVLFALAAATLVLLAAQFALAGFGAFSMVRNPAHNAYRAHLILGLVIGVLAWLILAAALASGPARADPRTWRPAAVLALLAIPVEPLLGDAGTKVPAVGALHALNGIAICALAVWLVVETRHRREAARMDAGQGGDEGRRGGDEGHR
jgi:hypothetical protein